MYSPNYNIGEYNQPIGAIPQQPGQLIQNAKFQFKKDYATWNQDIPPQRPKSREMELMDLLLVNNISKKQTSLPYINKNRSPKPENIQSSRASIPLHPQYHHFSPYPLHPGYPMPMNQNMQFQYFPQTFAQNQITHIPPQQMINSNRNQEQTVEYMKEMIKKQNEFQQRQEKLEQQIIKLRKKKSYKKLQQSEMPYQQQKLLEIPPPIYPLEQPRITTFRQIEKKKKKLHYQINMLKELQSIKNINNGIIESDSQQSSEPSVEYVQKTRKQRLKPVPIPPYYDLVQDEQRLKELIKQGYNYKIKRIFIMFSYLVFKKNEIIKVAQQKRKISKDKLPQLEHEYKTEMMKFSVTVSDPLVQKMAQQNVNLRVVETQEKKVTPKTLIQNSNNLKQYISDVFQAVLNYDLKKQHSLEYLNKITQNYEFLQQNYHSKFELTRLQYGFTGSLKDMKPTTQNMMIVFNFWIRFFIPLSFPETQKNIKDITEVMQTNLKTIVSALYQIALQACKNQAQPIPNNTKEIPQENITKEKNPYIIKLEQFKETLEEQNMINRQQQEKLEEPLIHPVYTLREMDKFFDNERSFISEKIQQLNNWCNMVMGLVNEFNQQEKQELQKQKKQQLESINQKVIEPKKKQVMQIIKDQKSQYQKNIIEIKQLKQKIIEEKEKNDKMKKEYEDALKKHEERQEKLILLGIK